MARKSFRSGWAGALAALAGAAPALAGGSPENVLVVINPGSAESMYLGNYYRNARNIPDCNVIYIDPAPASYAEFTNPNGALDALLGQLRHVKLDDHIDYIVIASGGSFFVAAPGYITDGCSPVTRFSQSSVFTMAYLKSVILPGGVSSQTPNQYYSTGTPAPFNSQGGWLFGNPSNVLGSRRYFIGAQLGYTGSLGNTVPEILAMIDRSVAADGSLPTGTFYLMNTTDTARNVRAPQFPAVVSAINGAGGSCQSLSGILPDGHADCLGVMTGWADPDVEGSSMALIPGAFGDHLTSWAATYDIGQQTKVSSWIRKGASGSSGEVEEPCNYTGKFVAANFHNLYFQGMSLGEAWLRSMNFVPFQGLLVGDPICRPFSRMPVVTGNAPSGALNGTVSFTSSATTPIGGASISYLDLYIDGLFQSRKTPGQPFIVNTAALPEGPHEWRVLAADSTAVRNIGRWTGTFSSTLYGRSVTAGLTTSSGDMTTLFSVNASSNATVKELRLIHNGRVVASSNSSPATLQVYGRNLGAGQSNLRVEAVFTDNRTARSAPMPVNVAYSVGAFSGLAPVASSYIKHVIPGTPCLIELPARFDDALTGATWTVVTPPAVGTLSSGTLGYRVLTTPGNSCGQDQLTFRVQTPSGLSNTATVTLIYGGYGGVYGCFPDMDGDNILSISDFTAYLQTYAAGSMRADMNGDCALNVADFTAYLQAFAIGCP